MTRCITNQNIINQIKELIPRLKEVNSKLQGESIKLFGKQRIYNSRTS